MRKDTDYNFHFKFEGEDHCTDVTKKPVSGPLLGRLVNHGDKLSHSYAVMKCVSLNSRRFCASSVQDQSLLVSKFFIIMVRRYCKGGVTARVQLTGGTEAETQRKDNPAEKSDGDKSSSQTKISEMPVTDLFEEIKKHGGAVTGEQREYAFPRSTK